MKFCTNCGNMYYIRMITPDGDDSDDSGAAAGAGAGVDTEDSSDVQLVHYCRNCGNQEIGDTNTTFVVSKKRIRNAESSFRFVINEYTHLDPTLPHTTNIPCPNDSCVSNKEDKPVEGDVCFLRYNNDDMKYAYLCCHCKHAWAN